MMLDCRCIDARVIGHLRLSAQWVVGALGQLTIDRTDLLGDMREGLVEELRSLAHRFFVVLFGFPGMLAGFLEVLLRRLELVLHTLETLHGTRVGRHLVKIAVERSDRFEQLVLCLVVVLVTR